MTEQAQTSPVKKASSQKSLREGGTYLVLADNSREFDYALKAAADLAIEHKGHVGVLKVIEDQGFQPWGGVEARMREEGRKRSEERLFEVSEYLKSLGAGMPIFYMEEGASREVILNIVKNDPSIKSLVLGDGKGKPNPLVHFFIDGGIHEIGIPLLVVPDLDDAP